MRKRVFCVLLCVLMMVSMVGCKGQKKAENAGADTYTYRQAISATPANFNPHDLSADGAFTVLGYTSMGFVGVGMDADKKFIRTYEMADSIEDITAAFDRKEAYGIAEGEKNRVWEIKLNKNAKWENGDIINADTYLYSMQQILDIKMKNHRATEFTDGITAIYKAKDYMYSGQWAPVYLNMGENQNTVTNGRAYDVNGKPLYYSLEETVPVLGCSLTENYEAFPEKFRADGVDYYQLLKNSTEKEHGFYVATEETVNALKVIAGGLGNSELWYVLTFAAVEYSAAWEDVGFFKTDDYTLIYITASAIEKTDLLGKFSTCFIVHPDTYERCKTQIGDLLTSSYGTSVDTYLSCGPYKLVSLENDKQIIFTKNENWYGYSDARYEDMYQTTDIRCDVIENHESQLEKFLMGELDDLVLTAEDMKTYKYSDYLLKKDESMVFSVCFNTNLEELIALENRAGDGKNRRVGAYAEFREAFSYAINRKDFTENGTAGSKPQYGILNSMYYYDIINDANSIYRNTDIAKKVIVDHYGIEYGEGKTYATLDDAYKSVTGFDVEKAKTLFTAAYNKMIADGNYTAGQQILLTCLASEQPSLNAEKKSQEALLNQYVAEATKGTGFEGKINITFTNSPTMYNDFVNGNTEMILSVKYGADMSPYYQLSKYIDTGNFVVPESKAYNPRGVELTIEIDGEAVTKTVHRWAKSINSGGDYVNASNEVKLLIMAKLEAFLIDEYIDIPIYSRCQVSLHSKKVVQGSDVYNPFYEFGGIAYMTYRYSDAQWEEYVEKYPNGISYE